MGRRYAFTLLLLFSSVRGQAIQGRVLTDQGSPLSYSVITHNKTGYWQVTDEQGFFILPANSSVGDSLTISRYGYNSKSLIISKRKTLLIILEPNPIHLAPILKTGSRSRAIQSSVIFQESKDPAKGSIEHRQLLSGVPGLNFRTYGGPGSIGILSLDGGSAAQTKVLVGGFDLTSAQNGEMDLSQLPLPFIQSARFSPNLNTSLGSGSTDGIIFLEPWTGNTLLSFSKGSYRHSAGHINHRIQYDTWSVRFLLGSRYDDGNYPVTWRRESFKRTNNYFEQTFGGVQIHKLWNPRYYLRILMLSSFQKRGIPGQVWSPSNAHREDQLHIIGSTMGWFNPRGDGKLQILIRHSRDHYSDEQYRIDSRHILNSISGKLNQVFILSPWLRTALLSEFVFDSLTSTQTGKHKRTVLSNTVSAMLNPIPAIDFKSGLRWDSASDYFSERTYFLNLTYYPNVAWIQSVGYDAGTTFRYPTFNELFWTPGGNLDLQPEHTKNQMLVFQFNLLRLGNLQVQTFDRHSTDLIQWIALPTYWHPINIKKAERRGWKGVWNWDYPRIDLSGFISYSDIKTINQNPGDHYGKLLRYAPRNTATVNLEWKPGNWTINTRWHHISRVISQYSWPEDIILPEVSLVTISVGYTMKIIDSVLILVLSVDNATDEAYETSKGYPESGRALRFTITYERN